MGEEGVKSFQYLEDLLTRGDSSRMTVEEAVKQHYGFRTVWVAALNSEVRDRLREVRLHGYPPRIFLSYRWSGEEIKAWVRELARGLEGRGFEVVLDQFHQIQDDSHLNVPRYVANVASCHYALVVITSSYCDVAGPRATEDSGGPDGWVLDEHQLILRLSNAGLLRPIGIWKEGDRVPAGFGPNNTIDVRADPDAARAAAFFRYQGLVLSSEEQQELILLVQETDRLLAQEDPAAASAVLERGRRFAETVDYQLQLAQVLAHLGDGEKATTLARSLLERDDLAPRAMYQMAGVLGFCGERQEAVRRLARLAKTDFMPKGVRYLLGNFLDDLSSFQAAVNHLRLAAAAADEPDPAVLNDLGMAYRHDGRWQEADDCFRRALEADPGHELATVNRTVSLAALGRPDEAIRLCEEGLRRHPGNADLQGLRTVLLSKGIAAGTKRPEPATTVSCEGCGAEYRLDPGRESICGDCGALYGGPKFHCPCCGNDGVVPVEAVALPGVAIGCPVCRKGRLKIVVREEAAGGPDSAVRWATAGELADFYLAPEIARSLAPGNQCLLLCCLANVVAYADPESARRLHRAAMSIGEDPGGILGYSLDQLPRFTAEVERKQYAPGEEIAEPSQVIRGATRIVNELAGGEVRGAFEIAQRFTWPRTQRLLLAGIHACALDKGETELAASIRAALGTE